MTTAPISAVPAAEPEIPGVTRPMTYEEYLASPEENARYDIIDGYKVYHRFGKNAMTSPSRIHQRILGNIFVSFRAYALSTKRGEAYQSPCDVLVQRQPVRTRQPDVLLISMDRLALNPPPDEAVPLNPAPELVVEMLSPSDTRRVKQEKIEDFCAVDVRECWLVSAEAETVEVLHLSRDGAQTVAIYGRGQTVAAIVFPGLTVPVDDIFNL
jgi:Uma2 family endonuclease